MRLRNVKKAFNRINDYEKLIKDPINYKGKWHTYFDNDNPIHIEIGMGRGRFLIEQAKKNPTINYIGFEKFTVVMVKSLDNIKEEGDISNLCVVRYDAQDILELFEENEVAKVYLNFSDPWPKERHYKRRLTYREFLKKYEIILRPEGLLCFKTDNQLLFDFSLREMQMLGMSILKETRNLHGSPWVQENIMTEYEEKFTKEGIAINMVEARFSNR
ncbi:tRNA (guanosine(46)-N7)-methyltransferase TrmB [Petrocella sp. FN5]|uniref:tRNA (guanosine(46)-N7)-methyltransferase TrmB n=1 Tax=Petrocella sp. FN5 TaxID=3032002 RepID=UPI0023DBE87C|nr:tRNA (guanosine(46)-N7)-methyltransferase TrmB [Petrocella sp. FN5]MDF1618361.1 tRNA (guanosine(46)-N7)-methyltransferase TrmB [Petrocella sp. FN5]